MQQRRYARTNGGSEGVTVMTANAGPSQAQNSRKAKVLRMKQRAKELYVEGYACAESIVKGGGRRRAYSADFVKLSSGFARGMSSGCLCGALAGAQLVIGAKFGRNSSAEDLLPCAERSKRLIDEFKGKYKLTCCRGLGGKLPPESPERKETCAKIVSDVADILDGILGEKGTSAGGSAVSPSIHGTERREP